MRQRELPNLVYRAFKVDLDGRAELLGDVLASDRHSAEAAAIEQFNTSYGGLVVVFVGIRGREAA